MGPPPPPPKPTVAIVNVPSLSLLPGTQASQPKGGLTISVAPATYSVKIVPTVSLQREDAPAYAISDTDDGPDVWGVRTTTSKPRGNPNSLAFLVTVSNQMSRVFHGAGTVVQFNVGGTLLPVDQKGYVSLQNVIIPPQSEQQVEVFGPPLDQLPAGKSTMSLTLYDVVTNQDAAGNVTEKQNYRWDFTLMMIPKATEVPPPTSREVRMSRQGFATAQAQISQENTKAEQGN